MIAVVLDSVMKKTYTTAWTNEVMDVDAIICVTMICAMRAVTAWTNAIHVNAIICVTKKTYMTTTAWTSVIHASVGARCRPIWVSAGDAAHTQDAMCADN